MKPSNDLDSIADLDKTRFKYNDTPLHCVAQTVVLRRHILLMRPCKANANHSKPFSLLGEQSGGNCSRLWRTRIIKKRNPCCNKVVILDV